MEFSELSTYLPLSEAGERYSLSLEMLTQAIEAGDIRAIKINEAVAVAAADVAVVAARVEAEAAGDDLISITQASKKLDIPISVVWRWQDYGWLPVLATGPRRAKLVSWQRVSQLGDLYKQQSQRGSRLIPRGMEATALNSLA